MLFTIDGMCNNARATSFKLAHGSVQTPIFMPVGTQGILKSLDSIDINLHLKTNLILANTYHLYLRPGIEVLDKFGGIHNFANFKGNYLTDSGGFQAFSLKSNAKKTNDGIYFKSHIDGSTHFFNSKKVLDIQYAINSDILMVLDDLIALPAEEKEILKSVSNTTKWANESINYHNSMKNLKKINNKIFAIIQGGVNFEARKISTNELLLLDFDGYAIGGLAVGEKKESMFEILEYTLSLMPKYKPRYLMGVGTPSDLLNAISLGVDMFDCVMPTRNARNASIFTSIGKLNIKNSKFKFDNLPLDVQCNCYTCQNFSRSFLHHLYKSNEISYHRLASIHNLHFYINLLKNCRETILNGTFIKFKNEKLEAFNNIV